MAVPEMLVAVHVMVVTPALNVNGLGNTGPVPDPEVAPVITHVNVIAWPPIIVGIPGLRAAAHNPGCVLTVLFTGQLICGGLLGVTVTWNVQVAVCPQASVAV